MTTRAIHRSYTIPKTLLQTVNAAHRSDAAEPGVGLERALVEVSRILVTESQPDLKGALGLVAHAIGAESAYLALVPPDVEFVAGAEAICGEPHIDIRQFVHGMDARGLLTWLDESRSEIEERGAGFMADQVRWSWREEPAVIAVPILAPGERFYGHVGFLYTYPARGMEENRQALGLFGDMLSSWLQRKILEEAFYNLERQMGQALEQQQQRFGRELHDGVGQFLTAVRILSSNLADRFVKTSKPDAELARKVVRFAEEASQCVREIYTGLAPQNVANRGLAVALSDLTAGVNSLGGPTCVFEHDGIADIQNQEITLHLYRIVQEAVNNALKYASATTIQISLSIDNDGLLLSVCDDGKGFTLESKRNGNSLGLRSMFYRARAVGGNLTVESEQGTCITCRVPAAAVLLAEKNCC